MVSPSTLAPAGEATIAIAPIDASAVTESLNFGMSFPPGFLSYHRHLLPNSRRL
jgi:hypothetical protein